MLGRLIHPLDLIVWTPAQAEAAGLVEVTLVYWGSRLRSLEGWRL